MRHRSDPKDDMLSLQVMEVETVCPEQADEEYEAFMPFLGEDMETESLLTPMAADSDLFFDTADLPPGSSFILLVDSDSNEFH